MSAAAAGGERATKPRRGRPPTSEAQFAARREEIVRVAYEVFTEKGYHASGIADIAERLQIGHGTVYRYFGNKREILDHVFDYGVAELMRSVNEVDIRTIHSQDDFRELLRTVGRGVFQRLDESPELPRLILLEFSAIDSDLTMRALGLIDTCIALAESWIATAMERQWLRSDLPPAHVARSLVGGIISGMLMGLRVPTTEAAHLAYIDTLVDVHCPVDRTVD